MTTSAVSNSATNPFAAIIANSATSTAGSSVSSTSSTTAGTLGSSQDLAQTFLTLLVAQMNNQDPLNPVDNSQLTTQMAQISTVTGINSLNSSISSLLSQMQQSATIQSAQLTGHSVMVAGSNLALNSSTSSTGATTLNAVGAYNLGAAAQNVTVTVQDANGNTVKTMQMGAQSAGLQDFAWDGSTDAGGTAAAGNYTFKVVATAKSGTAVAATPYSLQAVVGAVPQADGTTQLMLGNGSQVPYSAIAQII